MTVRTISIKWGSTNVGIEANVNMTGCELKEAIALHTNVSAKRQKILGAKIVDAEKLPEGVLSGKQRLLLIGSAEKATEISSSNDTEKSKNGTTQANRIQDVISNKIGGIPNLGNTCYLNASIQMLRTIPEIAPLLDTVSTKADAQSDAFAALFEQMLLCTNQSGALGQLAPLAFLQGFHQVFPSFAERSPEGFLMQHDAQEALTALLKVIEQNGASKSKETNAPFDALFRVRLREEFKCTEKGPSAEESATQKSDALMLLCRLHADTSTLEQGLQNSLAKETIEKHSDALGRNAQWERMTAIESLPKYVFVQIARFTWRQDTSQRAKILRPVNFPMTLDFKRFMAPQNESDAKNAGKNEYALQCVVSHKGRTADSGHYIAWTRKEVENSTDAEASKTSVWVVIDDENTSIVSEDDVKRLSGGGESHSAYVLLYKRIE